MLKPEREFFSADSVPFTPVAGDGVGLTERTLADTGIPGVVTRMLSFPPGIDTTPNGVQVHDFWEEVYILSGAITDLRLGQTFSTGMYACRPPGMPHGPWRTEGGCTTFEVRYKSSRP